MSFLGKARNVAIGAAALATVGLNFDRNQRVENIKDFEKKITDLNLDFYKFQSDNFDSRMYFSRSVYTDIVTALSFAEGDKLPYIQLSGDDEIPTHSQEAYSQYQYTHPFGPSYQLNQERIISTYKLILDQLDGTKNLLKHFEQTNIIPEDANTWGWIVDSLDFSLNYLSQANTYLTDAINGNRLLTRDELLNLKEALYEVHRGMESFHNFFQDAIDKVTNERTGQIISAISFAVTLFLSGYLMKFIRRNKDEPEIEGEKPKRVDANYPIPLLTNEGEVVYVRLIHKTDNELYFQTPDMKVIIQPIDDETEVKRKMIPDSAESDELDLGYFHEERDQAKFEG